MNISIKICGLTRVEDVISSNELGADYFGFIACEFSPRALSIKQISKLVTYVPLEKCVLVDVMPRLEKLKEFLKLGFKNFQIHLTDSCEIESIIELSNLVGKDSLWLAPKLKSTMNFNEEHLGLANTFLLDTYSAEKFGGTGRVGDWDGFKKLKNQYNKKQWILAGGIGPTNANEAISRSSATFLDINSSIESKPGIKDFHLMKTLFNVIGE